MINHLRGLAITYLHHSKIIRQNEGHEAEIEKYKRLYETYMTHFRMESDKNVEICISRSNGEDFSLIVEIVRNKKPIRLFEDAVGKGSGSKKSNLDMTGRWSDRKFAGKIMIGNVDNTSSNITQSNASTPNEKASA